MYTVGKQAGTIDNGIQLVSMLLLSHSKFNISVLSEQVSIIGHMPVQCKTAL